MKRRTRSSIPFLTLTLTLTLALSACGGTVTEVAEVTDTPTEQAVSLPLGSITSIDELRDAYVAAGGDCSEWKQTDLVRAAVASGDCSASSLLMMFQSSSAAQSTADFALPGIAISGEDRALLVGENWVIIASDVREVAPTVGGDLVTNTPATTTTFDLSTDAGLCMADADMTNLELNDAIAPMLGYSSDRDIRTFEQDQAIRAYKNAAFERACPERAG